jgi:DNA-binding NarL/FixJ family response regulator/multidrug efflux pump subunit AcrA (membrane-fusion protein)
MIRILLVDDLVLLCEVLQTWLEEQDDFWVVGRAHNGLSAIAQVEALNPDVVLMDIEMPQMNGIMATEIISQRFPQTKVIMLSACEDEILLRQSLQAGAQGYLLKTVDTQELANTIRFVKRGCHQIAPKLLSKLVGVAPSAKDSPSSRTTVDFTQPPSREPPLHQHRYQRANREIAWQESKSSRYDRTTMDFLSAPPRGVQTAIAPDPIKKEKLETQPDREHEPLKVKISQFPQKAKLHRLLLLCSGTLVFGLVWLLFGRHGNTPPPSTSKMPLPSNILPVTTRSVYPDNSYRESRFYTGTVNARRSSELGFEQPGQLIRLLAREGDRVKAGTPLAYLDTQNLEISRRELIAERSQAVARLQEMQAGSRRETIASARAAVRDLREQLQLASQKTSRREMLYTEGAIAREQLDETRSERSVLQARLDRAQSQLDELLAGTRLEQIAAQKAIVEQYDANLAKLQLQKQKSILKAPFDATVSRRLIDEGTILSAGQPVLRLVENKAIEVRIGIPTNVVAQMKTNSDRVLQIGEKNYPAKVVSVLPELNANTRTVTVVFRLNESLGAEISSGQLARLELVETVDDSGYWLPITALVKGTRGLWSCYVLSESQDNSDAFAIERRDVEVLHTQSDRAFVRGTIQEGDRVILSGTHRLAPGQLVRPVADLKASR